MSVIEQRVSALGEANRVRILRAQFRGELKQLDAEESRALFAHALVDLPDWFGGMDAGLALCLLPSLTWETADGMLWRADVFKRRPLRSLSPRQRALLAAMVTSGSLRKWIREDES